MELKVNWTDPIIKESDVLLIQPFDLDAFYVSASTFDKSNIYFVLLVSRNYFVEKKDYEKAAHLNYLIAYYLFITATPPGSSLLAVDYIKQAISLNPLEIYQEWLEKMLQGN